MKQSSDLAPCSGAESLWTGPEATGIGKASVTVKNPGYWKSQSYAKTMRDSDGVERGWPKPGGQGVYRGWQHQRSKWFQPFRAQKIMNEHQMSDTWATEFEVILFSSGFALVYLILWLGVWDRKICNLFFTLQEPIVKRLWDFKETLDFFKKKIGLLKSWNALSNILLIISYNVVCFLRKVLIV